MGGMAYMVMAYMVMAHTYIVMVTQLYDRWDGIDGTAYVVVAYKGISYIVMAHTVMATWL